MSAPFDALSAAARRTYRAARGALEHPDPAALVEHARRRWAENLEPRRGRRGLRSAEARTLAELGVHQIRLLAVHRYLMDGDASSLVPALRQEVALRHALARCRRVAADGDAGRAPETRYLRVPFLDGNADDQPPNVGEILRALGTGQREAALAVLPAALGRASGSVPSYRAIANLALVALHPDVHEEARARHDATQALGTKLSRFDRALIEALVALVEDRPDAFGGALTEAVGLQAKASWLHTPHGPASGLGKPVATMLFGLAVLAAWRRGRDWLGTMDWEGAPLWPKGVLDVLLDPSGPGAFITFGDPVDFLDEPESLPRKECRQWDAP